MVIRRGTGIDLKFLAGAGQAKDSLCLVEGLAVILCVEEVEVSRLKTVTFQIQAYLSRCPPALDIIHTILYSYILEVNLVRFRVGVGVGVGL